MQNVDDGEDFDKELEPGSLTTKEEEEDEEEEEEEEEREKGWFLGGSKARWSLEPGSHLAFSGNMQCPREHWHAFCESARAANKGGCSHTPCAQPRTLP
jgi:hypothetical protein